MGIKHSKQALREVAATLGVDTASARAYLRRVQQIVGPVPYQAILEAMRRAEDYEPEQVAVALRAPSPDGE